jgi:hypothetical protein
MEGLDECQSQSQSQRGREGKGKGRRGEEEVVVERTQESNAT